MTQPEWLVGTDPRSMVNSDGDVVPFDPEQLVREREEYEKGSDDDSPNTVSVGDGSVEIRASAGAFLGAIAAYAQYDKYNRALQHGDIRRRSHVEDLRREALSNAEHLLKQATGYYALLAAGIEENDAMFNEQYGFIGARRRFLNQRASGRKNSKERERYIKHLELQRSA